MTIALSRLAKPSEDVSLVDAAFGPNADWVAAVAQGDAVYFWDRKTNAWSTWPAEPGSRLTRVELSPDKTMLAVAAQTSRGTEYSSVMLIWNVATHQLVARYSNSSRAIAAIRFSPDGRYIAVGGWDSPIRLWGIP